MSKCQIDIKGDVLVFQTTSFKAEKGSVLHSGIFNRELASSLAAGAVLMVLGFFFAVNGTITVIHLVAAALLFALFFLSFRAYFFRESLLEIVLDGEKGMIETSLQRTTGRKKRLHSMQELSGIRLCHLSFNPENVDGIGVVEKIALQHGTVLPGFGEAEDFYTVRLDFPDENLTVFSTKEKREAEKVIAELEGFLRESKEARGIRGTPGKYILNI